MLVVQTGVGIGVLALLESPWRSQYRWSQSEALVGLAAGQLAEDRLVSVHPHTQRTLDKIITLASAQFAAIVDANAVVLRSSGPIPPALATMVRGKLSSSPEHPRLLACVPAHNLQVYEVRLPDELGQSRWLAVGFQDIGAQRAFVDAGLCLGAMMVVALLFLIPLVLARFRRWTTSLHALHTAIRRLALGVPCGPIPVAGGDEGAYLALAFNDMAGRLLASKRALVESNQRLELRVMERTEELHVANTALERQNVQLEQVTETALRFTDDVAHEFRTPLTVVAEFASLMADGIGGSVTPKQSEYLRFITDASRDLACLVDDFLDTSKLRARSLRVHRREVGIDTILDAVWPMLQARALSADVRLSRFVDAGTPLVFADGEKVGRAIINLTVNALKFSKPGALVTVHAAPHPAGGAVIGITDQGPGLGEAEVAQLFGRFQQSGSGRASTVKGFGLGLNIVRELVMLNLGSVGIESSPGKGSTFSFTLPPNEPSAIVDAFLSILHARGGVAETDQVGILRVVVGRPETLEDLQSWLGTLAYPLDLQLIGSEQRSLFLVGATQEVGRWRDRLLSEHRQEQSAGPSGEPLYIDVAVAVPLAEARERVLAMVMDPIPALEVTAS
jgi:signal transduction histidine kinase